MAQRVPNKRKSDRADETRRRILDSAAELFAERGYAATSVSDIIQASGVTKGGFYFHFPSKEKLAVAVLQGKREQWTGRVLSAAMREERGLDQLRALGRAFCALYQEDPSFRVLGRLSLELADQSPELARQLRPEFTEWAHLVASLVRAAQAEGDIRSDVDAADAAEVVVAAFHGMTEMSFFVSGGADLQGRMERFTELLEAGLVVPSAARPRARSRGTG
jgi:AcrR family transcriptional regulator